MLVACTTTECYGAPDLAMATRATIPKKELQELRERLVAERGDLKAQYDELEESSFATNQSELTGETGFDEEYAEHATSVWHLSDGIAGQDGGWASGLQPDGQHEFGYLPDAEPLGDVASAPPPDPRLYATYDGSMGEPKGPVLGTETGPVGKIKNALT